MGVLSKVAQPGSAGSTLSLLKPFPKAEDAQHAWRSQDFVAVDDSVRGGISKSSFAVVAEQKDAMRTEGLPSDAGEAIFSGFLDTTKLGGAGFASQSFQRPLPKQLDARDFAGLRLIIRQQPASAAGPDASEPGGGQAPVSSYVLNLRTTDPVKRPDGRNESSVIYEWDFDASKAQTIADQPYCANQHGTPAYVEAAWEDFAATYRGRPAEDAEKLDPAQIKGFSIMARSNFGKQSGDFELRLIELQALRNRNVEGTVGTSAVKLGISHQHASYEKDSLLGFRQAIDSRDASALGEALEGEYPGKPRFDDQVGQPALRSSAPSTTLVIFALAILLGLGWFLWSSKPRALLRKAGLHNCS